MQSDAILGQLVARSYRFIWIFAASIFLYSFISYIAAPIAAASHIIAIVAAYAISEILQRTLGAALWRALYWFIRNSDNPLPPRLYFLIDGWAVFLTAIILMTTLQTVLKIDVPYDPGPYEYLTGAAAMIFVGALAYAAAFNKI